MTDRERWERAVEQLQRDPLRHIVSLKMLARLGAQIELGWVETACGWALLLSFPSEAFEYDLQTYGSGRRIAVLEGTLEHEQCELLERLPYADIVVKTTSPAVAQHAVDALGARRVTAFASFTASSTARVAAPDGADAPGLVSSSELNDELRAVFAQNGYAPTELDGYFANGARWFAICRDTDVEAACFVFRNFEPIWEIGGVHTRAQLRRQGLAAHTVRAAVQHLLERGLVPRYQTEASNVASMELARRIGLTEFLRIEHLLVERRGPRPCPTPAVAHSPAGGTSTLMGSSS